MAKSLKEDSLNNIKRHNSERKESQIKDFEHNSANRRDHYHSGHRQQQHHHHHHYHHHHYHHSSSMDDNRRHLSLRISEHRRGDHSEKRQESSKLDRPIKSPNRLSKEGSSESTRHEKQDHNDQLSFTENGRRRSDVEEEDDDDEKGEWVEIPAKIFRKRQERAAENDSISKLISSSPDKFIIESQGSISENDYESSDSDIIGPQLPSSLRHLKKKKGPTLPDISDVQLQNSEIHTRSLEEARLSRLRAMEELADEYNSAADNLLADGGIDDKHTGRRAEKRKIENDDRKSYARARSPGGVAELDDSELLSGDLDRGGVAEKVNEIAVRKSEKERIKREKREAFFREKDAERRKRWEEMQEREQKTIEMLRELAKQRFGS
ncbi:hypothetical protein V1511DRAFT_506125 [Dipodascopsis uninucleata]